MLQVSAGTRILVAARPVDFRRGIDGLARECRAALGANPFSGAMFVFTNRRRTALKVLVYDGQGFWLCHKRLSEGRFRWWPTEPGSATKQLLAAELAVLLGAGDPSQVRTAPLWRPVAMTG